MRKKLLHNIEALATQFFIDTTKLNIADAKNSTIKHWNTTAHMLGYFLKTNTLVFGEPGWGKTTLASLVSSVCSGFPVDLYRSVMISGHPDQTENSMIARPDYGKLLDKREVVIWNNALYLPSIMIDEFNRLPEGKQCIMLDPLAAGRFNYLNDTFYTGDVAFFATANYTDGGNHKMSPPILDRFPISLEMNQFEPFEFEDAIDANKRVKIYLCNPALSTSIIRAIKNPDEEVEDKLKTIAKLKKKALSGKDKYFDGLEMISQEEFEAMREQICAIEFTAKAAAYREIIQSEFNDTDKFGSKRSCDEPDTDIHGNTLASVNSRNGVSFRVLKDGITLYSQAIAYLTGAQKVGKEHIDAIGPYCLAHKLNFTDDCIAKYEQDARECRKEEHMVTKLLTGCSDSFEIIFNDLAILQKAMYGILTGKGENSGLSESKMLSDGKNKFNEVARYRTMLEDAHKLPHPLLRKYASKIIELR